MMKGMHDVERRMTRRLVALLILLLGLDAGCRIDGGEAEDPGSPVSYAFRIIHAQAWQRVTDEPTYLASFSLSATIEDWEEYTFKGGGGGADDFLPTACTGFLAGLEKCSDIEDATQYMIDNVNVDGTFEFDSPSTGRRAYAGIGTLLQDMKFRSCPHDGIKSVYLLNTAQLNLNFLNYLDWASLANARIYLGMSFPKRLDDGTPLECYYDDVLPNGVIFLNTAYYFYTKLEDHIYATGFHNADEWTAGEFQPHKFFLHIVSHEVNHQLGCWHEHNEAVHPNTLCTMTDVWPVFTAWHTEAEVTAGLRNYPFAVCVCSYCSPMFCPLSTYQQ